jgi:hypothetical protein
MMVELDFEPIFRSIERAIEDHPRLELAKKPDGEPEFTYSRLGAKVTVRVKLKGSRKNPVTIRGDGDDFLDARDDLIRSLDLWADAIE